MYVGGGFDFGRVVQLRLSAKCESSGFNSEEHKTIPILPDELDAEY